MQRQKAEDDALGRLRSYATKPTRVSRRELLEAGRELLRLEANEASACEQADHEDAENERDRKARVAARERHTQ